MQYRVPFVNAPKHFARYRADFERIILSTLDRGQMINRQELRDFEDHLARFVGVKHAVGVNSGYHALHLSMVAAGIGPGDEVVTVAHTFVATISAIIHCGATPVLIDVGDDHNMDPDAFERAITNRTKAVIPVHLNGRLCDMDRVMTIAARHHLTVIEDAAQSLGASFKEQMAGSFGKAGCFSFYPFKILGCFGDGGAVTTDDAELARAVRLMRFNGEDRDTGEYHYHGYTALLDNLQAAVLDFKLPHLPEWIAHRRAVADHYRSGLTKVGDLTLPHVNDDRFYDAYQNYVVTTGRRDELKAYLRNEGIETLVSWPKPVWEHQDLHLGSPHLPKTERLCREVLSLPMSAETTFDEVDVVGEAVRAFFAQEFSASSSATSANRSLH